MTGSLPAHASSTAQLQVLHKHTRGHELTAALSERRTYLLGRLAKDITDSSSAPQAVTQDGNDAHQQGVARPLHIIVLVPVPV